MISRKLAHFTRYFGGLVAIALTLSQSIDAETNSFDHIEYLRELGSAQFERGERLYQGLCVNCHGADGNTPSLPLAPAFTTGTMKFGLDAYAMFKTLTHGNGLMAPQQWMSPEERYDVIHYIRETFLKSRADHVPLDEAYFGKLQAMALEDETPITDRSSAERDFGTAIASQLGKDHVSVLTVKLADDHAMAYDLHSMDMVGLWKGGFLDLSETQHERLRGEGTPKPAGTPISGLQIWQWAHDGLLGYPKENLLPRGPMPETWLDYQGHYVHGDQVVLSYAIDGRSILEMPGKQRGAEAVTQTLRVERSDKDLKVAVAELPTPHVIEPGLAILGDPDAFVGIGLVGDTAPVRLEPDAQGNRLVLHIPASEDALRFQIVRTTGSGQPALDSFRGLLQWKSQEEMLPDLRALTNGGLLRWPENLVTQGLSGGDADAYVIDTLPVPEKTPWNTWFRTSALAFDEDGVLYVSTHGGDIWTVRGLERGIDHLEWKRFAAGLFEPFGLQVVGQDVFATCRDRLVRLRDLNADGEADFYESFSADEDVSTFFHAYNFDLMRDRAGNFYYVKAGQYTSHAFPGGLIKVSADGASREMIATGFRTPNGMGILPDDRLTVSDNQGNWIPASKVSLIKPGGYYGYAQTHARPGSWAPDGGRIDHREEALPQDFDQPLIWLPQHVDNSSGGQLWVEDGRWGPLSGRFLHTSFGKGWLYYFLLQEFGDVSQAAVVRLPMDFETGIMRARVNPLDGQVYTVGLNGWNGNGRKGLGEGGLFRVRYTGKPLSMVTQAAVRDDGLELGFNFALDPDSVTQLENYTIEQWNYRWLPRYGSENWSVKEPNEKGKDTVVVTSAERTADGRGVVLHIPDLQPANQLHLRLRLKPKFGAEVFEEELYWTINGFPDGRRWQQTAPVHDQNAKKKKGKSGEWIRLFDGGTLTGWQARAEGDVSVYNGEIQLRAKKNLWLAHDRVFDNFILEAEVKLPPSAEVNEGINSGIAYRCQGAKGKPKGYQFEIDGTDRRLTGGLYAIGAGGWIWPTKRDPESAGQFLEMTKGSFRRDDWNRIRIECRGATIRHYVNGIPTAEIEDDRFKQGYIALQHHGRGGAYRFRSVRVKRLEP